VSIAWPDNPRDRRAEKRKEDYDENGFHTSSLWGSRKCTAAAFLCRFLLVLHGLLGSLSQIA
jgi:hypothetical protein